MSESELEWTTLAENLKYAIDGEKIIFKVDYSITLRKSKSGKTNIIATCGRPKPVTLKDGSVVYVNLTLYRYPE